MVKHILEVTEGGKVIHTKESDIEMNIAIGVVSSIMRITEISSVSSNSVSEIIIRTSVKTRSFKHTFRGTAEEIKTIHKRTFGI